MTRARVTTVIPTRARPALLGRAVASAATQGPETVVDVFDNASPDDTPATTAALAARYGNVRVHRHAEDIGALANFAWAIDRVETEFFSVLSDDDALLPGVHGRAVAALDAMPAMAFWAGRTLNVGTDGRVWDVRPPPARSPAGLRMPPDAAASLTGGRAPTWTGIVFRTSVVRAVGPPEYALGGPFDLDYLFRLAARHPFFVDDAPAAVFTLNPESFSATQPLSTFWPGWRAMIARVAADEALPPARRGEIAAALEHDAARMLLRRGVDAAARGRVAFVRDAGKAYRDTYGADARWAVLAACAAVTRWPGGPALLGALHRWGERRIVAGRADLHARYGGLIPR